MTTARISALLLTLLFLAGCGGPRAVLWHGPNSNDIVVDTAAKPADIVPIYVATSRQRSNDLSLPYNAKRSPKLNFARVDVGIPSAHKSGFVESTGYKPNPAKNFAAVAFQPYDNGKVFLEKLNAALAARPADEQEILLFVHGYNNNFADSTFREAQFVHDFGFKSVAVHYAWPSAGSLGLYAYDRDSANFARDGLAELLEIVSRSKAKRILLVGHSMGTLVVMEALRTLAISGKREPLDRLTGVMLAAPDIDVDVFEEQVRDIGKLPRPFAVLVSSKDRALNLSGRITGGHPRVGDGSSIQMLRDNGIAVLDLSAVDGGSHDVFASSPTLMTLVRRGGLTERTLQGEGQTPGEAILADGSSVIEGAASLVIYLPVRIFTAAAGLQR
ncbi:alpha/beta fold hydrolase [Phyllobacterium salinisoli]|uniref:Alpha/beta fold hydrolase n=1 Tax=Phyllobacterium salinisoli TaxID=1899321 RepID=A0A368KAU1_9HYPH|nr:alpha/beta fold hydrolase [Phyllobacterium salinisoli]RCS25532.1 alpha/beta fold hydrolase [Phyllobacterium salinisoli]